MQKVNHWYFLSIKTSYLENPPFARKNKFDIFRKYE